MQNCANDAVILSCHVIWLFDFIWINLQKKKVKYLWFGFIYFLYFFVTSKAEGLPEVIVVNLSGSYRIDDWLCVNAALRLPCVI